VLDRERICTNPRQLAAALSRHSWLVTAALCLLVLILGIHGQDLAAQDYRVWAFRTHGFLLWDINWYGGNTDIGYSVLFPVVGSFMGASVATATACVLSAFVFGRVVNAPTHRAAALSRLWFAVFAVGDLVVGRGPFAWSAAMGMAAILAVIRRRSGLALVAAILTSLFSPLGALFLLLAGFAWTQTIGWRRALPLAGAVCGLAVSFAAKDGGLFPFTRAGFAGQVGIVLVGLVLTPRTNSTIRRGLGLYGVACVALFLVPNPVGGNIVRLAGLVAGPLAAYVLVSARRRRLLILVAGPLLAFQLLPVVTATAWASDDPSDQASYYTGVLSFLEAHQAPLGRVEIPFTRDHWEATYVAEQVDLARGWDRQIDLQRNAVLYKPMGQGTYRAWLDDNAVRYIALADVPLDAGGAAEAALLRHPPRWLRLVYRDPHWQVWALTNPQPMAEGSGGLSAISSGGFTVASPTAGPTLVRVRWSTYWHVDAGSACIAKSPGGWTTVDALGPGTIHVTARITLDSDACAQGSLPAEFQAG
jgi:hypothetical protein